MQTSQTIAISIAAIAPAFFLARHLHRRGISLSGVVAGSGSLALLSLVCATGISLYFASSLNFFLLVAATPALGFLLLFALSRAEAESPISVVPAHDLLVLGVAFAAAILSFGRQFEYASFWGDIGVYLTAIGHFFNGSAVSFEVVEAATDLARADGAPEILNGINPAASGLYQFHGLPTWAAFAAIWGEYATIASILFGLVIVQFYQLASRLIGSPRPALAVTIILACLPLAWHQALYPTAEMLLLSIVLGTILLVSLAGSARAIPVLVGVLAYGFTHVGIVLLAPLAGLAIAGFGFGAARAHQRQWALSALLAAVGCLTAIGYGMSVSEKYVSDIFGALFGSRMWLVYSVALTPLVGVIPWVLRLLEGDRQTVSQALTSLVLGRGTQLMLFTVACILVVTAIQAYLLGWSDHYRPESWNEFNSWSSRVSYVNKGFATLAHVAFLNAALASAVVGIVAFVLIPIDLIRKRTPQSWTMVVLWFAAAYCVVVFCVIRVDVTNNYYASRYFLPGLTPLLLLLAGCWIAPRMKLLLPALVLVGATGLYFVSALLGAGFYQGDRWFVQKWMSSALPDGSAVYFHGSDWLRYLALDRMFVLGRSDAPEVSADAPAILLTDMKEIIGGLSDCVVYPQRMIPWQINYPVEPLIELHQACAVKSRATSEYRFPSVRWIQNGELSFLLAAAPGDKKQEVSIGSRGWWSEKAPFKSNLDALEPTLTFCGETVGAVKVEPKRLVFRVQMKQPFCLVHLRTATFVPAEIGEGTDRRRLGIDVLYLRSDAIP